MITQKYNLNLIPDKVPVQVNCSQYDSLSRTIEFTIYDGTVLFEIPSGSTVTVRGTKSDNTGFEYPCTFDGSVVSFDIQAQMTIFSGRVPCEIRFVNGGIIGTCNFNLYVEPTPLDTDVTISETDLPLLEEAEQNAIRAEQAADQAESLLSTVVKSVNNELPDAQGNVDIVALPNGGTTGQVLTKQSNADGDADWEDASADLSAGVGISIANDTITNTAPIWHGDEVGDLPVPINADQLQGHPASYFATQSDIAIVRGSLTLNSPFVLCSWGHATYTIYGDMAVINITAFTLSAAAGSGSPICNLPFTVRDYQGGVIQSSTNTDKMLIFTYAGHTALYSDGGNASGEYYMQLVVGVQR